MVAEQPQPRPHPHPDPHSYTPHTTQPSPPPPPRPPPPPPHLSSPCSISHPDSHHRASPEYIIKHCPDKSSVANFIRAFKPQLPPSFPQVSTDEIETTFLRRAAIAQQHALGPTSQLRQWPAKQEERNTIVGNKDTHATYEHQDNNQSSIIGSPHDKADSRDVQGSPSGPLSIRVDIVNHQNTSTTSAIPGSHSPHHPVQLDAWLLQLLHFLIENIQGAPGVQRFTLEETIISVASHYRWDFGKENVRTYSELSIGRQLSLLYRLCRWYMHGLTSGSDAAKWVQFSRGPLTRDHRGNYVWWFGDNRLYLEKRKYSDDANLDPLFRYTRYTSTWLQVCHAPEEWTTYLDRASHHGGDDDVVKFVRPIVMHKIRPRYATEKRPFGLDGGYGVTGFREKSRRLEV